jgi:D-arginine dehydrogenase
MAQPALIVVGAGIAGCLIARELAARGAAVTVLERDTVGAGASRRSAGLHLARGATPRTRAMSAASHAYYAELRLRSPGLPIYPVGATLICDREPAGYLTAPVPAARVRGIRIPNGYHAWRIEDSHLADVYALTQAIAAGLRSRVRVAEGVAVTGLGSGPAAVTVDTSTGERLTADYVVLAPGPWLAAPAWRDLVAPLGLRVKKVAALHIARQPGPADEAVVLDADDAFLLPVGHRGHWLFSYASQDWDVEPDAPARGLSHQEIQAARACLRRYSPALAAACDGGRVFCDAYSPSREPLVSPVDEAGRIVFAGAASGSGYRLAPALAAEVADYLAPAWEVTGDHQYV